MATGARRDAVAARAAGRRERKKRHTRDALSRAALRLFVERGFEATTVEDITEAVDVAPRTFFRYFPSKEEVVLPDKSELLGHLRRALAARPPDEPIHAFIREAVLTFGAALSDEDMRVALLRARLLTTTPTLLGRYLERQAVWEELIASAVGKRLRVSPRRSLRCQLLATTAVATLRAAFSVWLAGGAVGDFRTVIADAFALLDQDRARARFAARRDPRDA